MGSLLSYTAYLFGSVGISANVAIIALMHAKPIEGLLPNISGIRNLRFASPCSTSHSPYQPLCTAARLLKLRVEAGVTEVQVPVQDENVEDISLGKDEAMEMRPVK
ncbi:hypothetical protein PRIPAC_78564 [Pristionchus pacificus]|uniref:Uncharacterized protein n=1 Tax=Pristionchus pacificus TaxID=54126 RepID=A0A2A6CQB0_PRIPA|nr:hypothetical protein PRIPAC_78564 [Pristionchus pacificus]|eukprot:PDM80329.1 hypothetical protein PRIPAC_32908 [Pristionchus pacificus]